MPAAAGRKNTFQAVVRIVLYVAAIGAPAVLGGLLGHDEGFRHNLAVSAALLGYTILGMQFVLAARIRWMERPFGLDMIFSFHKSMGAVAGVLLVSHPLLMALASGSPVLLTGLWSLDYWPILLGRPLVVLVIVQVLLAVWFIRAVPYQVFLWLHNVLGAPLLIGGFVHSMWLGDDLEVLPLGILWSAVFVVGIAAFVYTKTYGWRRARAGQWEVADVRRQTHNVHTITLRPPVGTPPMEYRPGQFQFLKLLRGPGLPREEHPWTISSSPAQPGTISSTIKASGDFTATIAQTRVGDRGIVRGPFGRFSYTLHPDEGDLVFIAGGIGITPLMSMIRHMRDVGEGRSVLLLYANRSQADIVFREELDHIAAGDHPRLRIIHLLDRADPGWTGLTGRISLAMFKELFGPDPAGRAYYVCGPPIMADKARAYLVDMGVPAGRIHFERFWL